MTITIVNMNAYRYFKKKATEHEKNAQFFHFTDRDVRQFYIFYLCLLFYSQEQKDRKRIAATAIRFLSFRTISKKE